MKTGNLFFRILLYLFGITIVALGAVLILKTTFGSGSMDAFNYNLYILINNPKIDWGVVSIISGTFTLAFVMIYRRKLKYLITLIPIFITGFFIDFWNNIVFNEVIIENIILKILTFIVAVLILSFGLALMIRTNISTMVYDELTFVIMDITKTKSFSKVRVGFEITATLLALMFGLLADGKFHEVKYGTVIISFLIGPLISMWTKMFEKLNFGKEKSH